MNPPVLSRRLVLEEAQRVPDGAGGFSRAWVALGTLWAELRPGAGQELAGESVTLSLVSYRIVVRGAPFGAPSRPRPEQRLREGQRVFVIEAVTEADPAGQYLVCHAHEEAVA